VLSHFISRKSTALGWLVIVALVVLLALRQGLSYDASILNLLPESDQQPLIQQAGEQINKEFSQRLILVLSGQDDQNLRRSVGIVARNLAQLTEISKVYWQLENSELSKLRDELYPFRFQLLDNGIRQLLLDGQYQAVRDRALLGLYGPFASSANSLSEDPFGLHSALIMNQTGNLNLQVSNSLLKITNASRPSYLMILTLNGDAFSPELQTRVLGAIATQHNQLSGSVDKPRMSGMLIHAAAGAQQAKNEISTIGLGSLIGIVIVVLFVFRRFKPLVLLLFPVAIGCVFATAIASLIFDKVHLVTFAFGAGLVGVSIDYAMHFLCERRVSAASGVLDRILPGLVLGLFSSVMAYAALLLTPFPGLRQMAVFSVAGLGASWLTVVLWFPLLTANDARQAPGFTSQLASLRERFPKLESRPRLAAIFVLPVMLAVGLVWNAKGQDDIRLLQTSPESLLAQEQQLRELLGTRSSSRFFLVSAATLESNLQKQEQLVAALEVLKQDGLIDGFQSLSTSLPSIKRQVENIALVESLYASQLASFYRLLNLTKFDESNAVSALEQAKGNILMLETWEQLALSREQHGLFIGGENPDVATVIRITGNLGGLSLERLNALATATAGVIFVDSLQNISMLMERYRIQVSSWVVLAYLVVFLVLLVRYKNQLWRVVLPPLLASVFTLAILAQVEGGINLFHVMALILVLGIGLDMGIFLIETGEASHTWLAVSLSAFTSLMAFGLLALSETPVLHHFGLTVAIGLTLVWLFAPMMRQH
jgi:predicted exporter